MTRKSIYNWVSKHKYNTYKMLHIPLTKQRLDHVIKKYHFVKHMSYYVDVGMAHKFLVGLKKFNEYKQPISYCVYKQSARYYYWLALYSVVLENHYGLDIVASADKLMNAIEPDSKLSHFLYTIIDGDEGAYLNYIYKPKLKPIVDIYHLNRQQQIHLRELDL